MVSFHFTNSAKEWSLNAQTGGDMQGVGEEFQGSMYGCFLYFH